MAIWGDKKEERQLDPVEYARAIVKAEMLAAEVERLHKQIEKLQEALVAATAPKAYDSMQNTKNMVPDTLTPEQLEARKRAEEESEFWSNHISYTEKPLFDSADELVESLGKMVGYDGAVAAQEVQPGNTES